MVDSITGEPCAAVALIESLKKEGRPEGRLLIRHYYFLKQIFGGWLGVPPCPCPGSPSTLSLPDQSRPFEYWYEG